MKWTIEKVRQLPEDNWLGIKRIGAHAWQIGDEKMMMLTGDGGVVEYCKVFDETLIEDVIKYAHDYDQKKIVEQYKDKPYESLTETKLKELIQELFFGKIDKNGMAQTK